MKSKQTEQKDKRTNPLEELVVEDSEMQNRTEIILKNIIQPYVYILKDQKKILFKPEEFENLSNKLRVLLLFLGNLAMEKLGYISNASISQKEAIEVLTQEGIPEGTIKPALKQLRDEKIISEVSSGRYAIGFEKLNKIKAEFFKNESRKN